MQIAFENIKSFNGYSRNQANKKIVSFFTSVKV